MRVVIIGGGIGGLTAAVALRQQGLDARVFEAAPELAAVGKGIWVPTNAMQVLHRLGLGAAVAARGFEIRRIELHDRDAGVLQALPLDWVEERFGYTTVSILRSELQFALADALPEGVLHLARRCSGIEERDEDVVARFEDGSQVAADLIIGADGVRSVVRDWVSPGSRLRDSGQVCSLGLCDYRMPPELDGVVWEVWGPGHRIGFSAVSDRRVYWFAPRTTLGPSGCRESLSLDALRELYADFSRPVPELLDATREEDIVELPLADLEPLPNWSRGRVTLLGDAAHAMTPNAGQGGAQAIEDGFVLARQLAATKDLAKALADYERLRKPKTSRIATDAWRLGRIAHLRPRVLRWLRNGIIRSVPRWMGRRQMVQVYSLDYQEDEGYRGKETPVQGGQIG